MQIELKYQDSTLIQLYKEWDIQGILFDALTPFPTENDRELIIRSVAYSSIKINTCER